MIPTTTEAVNVTECYYAQILDCGRNIYKGFDAYGQVLAISAWLTVILGIVALILSIQLRRLKASSCLPIFTHFECFLVLYTLSCILGSLALTLSAFHNISSLTFYSILGPRNVLVYIAIMVYVDIVFSANTHRDEFIDRLRKIYLRILYFPIAIVFGLFIYQGYLSDLYHYGREDGKGGYTIRPRDDDTTSLFTRIQFINTVLWLLCFLVLLIFVIIGRSSFSRYMRDVVEPELQKENERWAVTSGNITLSSSSSPNKFSSSTSEHKKQPRSHMRELSSTLKSSIWTMKWIAWALGLFLLYSIFFAIVVLFLEESVGIYYATLAVNWWSPTGFGGGIFGIVVYQKWRQVRRAKRDLWDEISEASGNGVGMEARNISSYTA